MGFGQTVSLTRDTLCNSTQEGSAGITPTSQHPWWDAGEGFPWGCFIPQCPGGLVRPPQAVTYAGTQPGLGWAQHSDIKQWLGSRAELP